MKAIIFDFDGVIYNTFDVAYNVKKGQDPNITKENFLSYFDGNFIEKINTNFSKQENDKFYELLYDGYKNLKLNNTIRYELEGLSKQYDLFIISSNLTKNIEVFFKNNNFDGVFKEILAAELNSSKQEKFKILFEKYNLNSENCIFITDTLGDILEANKLGVKSIAVDFGYHEKQRLEKGNPFKIVSNFSEIGKIIKNI